MAKKPDLPHSVMAEESVLGSMIISEAAIAEAELKIDAGYFHVPRHQLIYAEIIVMWHGRKTIDLVTFTQHLVNRTLIETVGGADFITHLFTAVPSAVAIGHYIEIVRDKYILRQMLATCTEGARRATDEQHDVDGLLADVRDRICQIDSDKAFTKRRTSKELADAVLHAMDNPETAIGLPTGLNKLDEAIGGLAPQSNIVIAGRTSGGKSALVQQIANFVAVDSKTPVAIFTFEMSDEQTMRRIIQIRSEVSALTIPKGKADMLAIQQFQQAAAEVGQSPLHIISDRLDVAGIRARCMQLKPRVAIVDYLQIIPEKSHKGESRTERFDRMSAEIKQIAMQLGITTITLSQLNEKDSTYGSSMFTNDADILIVIERVGDSDDTKATESKLFKIAKQRDGSRPQLSFTFVKAITKFREK